MCTDAHYLRSIGYEPQQLQGIMRMQTEDPNIRQKGDKALTASKGLIAEAFPGAALSFRVLPLVLIQR